MNVKTSKVSVPKDVTALCEQVARGYERRRRDYERRRLDVIYSRGSGVVEFGGRSGFSNPNAYKSERLERLEGCLDVKLIHAVDEALLMLGADVVRESRERLRRAMLLNCENGREFPYEVLGLDEFSRSDFYRRKKGFIKGIGVALGLVEV